MTKIEARKDLGPTGVMYALLAKSSGLYPNVRGGTTYLNAGDVWKFGETSTGYRYPGTLLTALNVSYKPLFRGTQMEAKLAEKYALYDYVLGTLRLPPGNRIFR